MSIKLPKNDFTRKNKDFDTLSKLPKNVGDLGKLFVALNLAQSPINRPIWSHCQRTKIWPRYLSIVKLPGFKAKKRKVKHGSFESVIFSQEYDGFLVQQCD